MKVDWIPTRFPIVLKPVDVAGAICEDPDYCIWANAAIRTYRETYGGTKPRVHFEGRVLSIYTLYGTHHFRAPKFMNKTAYDFDWVGKRLGVEEARRRAPVGKRGILTYTDSVRKKQRSEKQRVDDNVGRKKRRIRYIEEHGHADPQKNKRFVGVAMGEEVTG